LLEQSPMLALFATIGLGYAIGRVSIAGFSLGVGAVLFAGLALGAIAPKAAPPALVSFHRSGDVPLRTRALFTAGSSSAACADPDLSGMRLARSASCRPWRSR
jgi:hypothetical protein